MLKPPFFICEVSSNHNKNLDRCHNFIDISKDIGCQAVKFQLFKIDKLFAPEILSSSETHCQRREWELPSQFIPEIGQHCKEKEIDFCCTPFYLEAIEELEPHINIFKIASYEILWHDLIKECAATLKPLIISSGMANMDELDQAVEVALKAGCKDLTIFHCVSGYPAPVNECNLSVLATLQKRFKSRNIKVGWSDHSGESGVLLRSLFKWDADGVEFHLDLDTRGREYNLGHCWLPSQIKPVIDMVNIGMESDGVPLKKATFIEEKERNWRSDPTDGLRPMKSIRNNWK